MSSETSFTKSDLKQLEREQKAAAKEAAKAEKAAAKEAEKLAAKAEKVAALQQFVQADSPNILGVFGERAGVS